MLEELKQELRYDPVTGDIWWAKQNRFNSRQMHIPADKLQHTGPKRLKPYKTINYRCKSFFSHRVAFLLMTGEMPSGCVDHINGNSIDNRWENLRVVSHSENSQNRKADSDSKTGLLGVKKYTHPKTGNVYYFSSITVKGKANYLGCFKTANEAHAAYMAAKAQYHPTSPIKKQDSK